VDKVKAEALRLQPGDMLFNEGGDRDKLGRGWVWEGQIDECIHQNHVFRGRLNSTDFDPYFVSTHANTWGRAWFEAHGRQTTNLASISLSTLRQLPVPIAPIVEQRAIVADLASATDSRKRLANALIVARARAVSLRRALLATAFSGRLAPQNPTDEPASALLEHILADQALQPVRNRRAPMEESEA
jgi:type I restriction enzyme S subunit